MNVTRDKGDAMNQMRIAFERALRRRVLTAPTACLKVSHKSVGSAMAHVRALRRLDAERKNLADLNAYKCPRCLHWHVGHARTLAQPVRVVGGNAPAAH